MYAQLLGNPKLKKNSKLLLGAVSKIDFLTDSFKFFVTQEWIFDCNRTIDLQNEMSPADWEIFNFDLRKLEWETFLYNYLYGIQKFIIGDDPVPDFKPENYLLEKRKQYFNDITWTMSHGKKAKVKSQNEIKAAIMNSDEVIQVIGDLAAKDMDPKCRSDLDR